ncbi:DUF4189 domain-containing protein [Mycolicibacterium sp.]|uniref:DUF4189 domain-containing protein n=1 Tax=Mycolicibacterium sp. TaxID=2320850 RepID=UPI001DE1F3D6|nr:DUF4189 domain-containing protein [Mycolicibacterium sp.]MCB1290379.1 DUF4189 domain-containing protein [Mycobacterium sp.]MCB9409481.1 DUF4189 domain-containing protein [Mycolicibacterium sp.]
MRRSRLFGGMVAAITVAAVLATPRAHADDGWVAVANSPNHEQQDFGYGPDQATAEANALAQCALLQRADDCRVLASSTDCVATAWDVSEPLNLLYAGSGGGPEAAALGAIAAAGPYANDVQVRCTWWPRNEPGPTRPEPILASRSLA